MQKERADATESVLAEHNSNKLLPQMTLTAEEVAHYHKKCAVCFRASQLVTGENYHLTLKALTSWSAISLMISNDGF